MNINKYIVLLSLLFCSWTWAAQRMMLGSITFPNTLSAVPPVRIYCSGIKTKTEIEAVTKKILFSFMADNQQREFYILIADEIYPVMHDACKGKRKQNTVAYLRVPAETEYKLYRVESVPLLTQSSEKIDALVYTSRTKKNEQPRTELTYTWVVTEQELDENRQIPDNAIIVRLPAEYIETLAGGNRFELPSIKIKSNLGSEYQFMQLATALVIDSIDLDTIHVTQKEHTQLDQGHPRTIILPTT